MLYRRLDLKLSPRTNKSRQHGFTLTEVIVVIAIIGILTGILFPVFARAKEAARSTSCLSNLHQLGISINLYAQDVDDKSPGHSAFNASNTVTIPIGFGWAGKIYPYAKSAEIYRCPSDGTQVNSNYSPVGASVISYAINENLAGLSLSQATSSAKSVVLFEVEGTASLVKVQDEELSGRGTTFTLVSASGTGMKGDIIDSAVPNLVAEITTFYATGILDNSENDLFRVDYMGRSGRHRNGANFLALDGHSKWTMPLTVSAGTTAKSSASPQSPSGCTRLGSNKPIFPCAEGAEGSVHRLTFSTN